MITDVTLKAFTLYKFKGVGSATVELLAGQNNFAYATWEELAHGNVKLARALEGARGRQNAEAAVKSDLALCEQFSVRILSILDADYPFMLRQVPDRPFFLYVRGKLAESLTPVAITGSVEPTEHGARITARIAEYLQEESCSLISGLGFGCESIVHQTALSRGGHTVAVMAHGLQMVAPAHHRQLADAILANGGALISEYDFNVTPYAHQYVKRSRIIAGMSQGTVLVQGDLDAHCLHEARAAMRYERMLIVPLPTDRDQSARSREIRANNLLAYGTREQKLDLLACHATALNHLYIVHHKDQYRTMMAQLRGKVVLENELRTAQVALF